MSAPRKNVKLYMKDPVIVEDQSITTEGKQKLVIDRKELDEMSGKRVLVVDDVISTGGSLKAPGRPGRADPLRDRGPGRRPGRGRCRQAEGYHLPGAAALFFH